MKDWRLSLDPDAVLTSPASSCGSCLGMWENKTEHVPRLALPPASVGSGLTRHSQLLCHCQAGKSELSLSKVSVSVGRTANLWQPCFSKTCSSGPVRRHTLSQGRKVLCHVDLRIDLLVMEMRGSGAVGEKRDEAPQLLLLCWKVVKGNAGL